MVAVSQRPVFLVTTIEPFECQVHVYRQMEGTGDGRCDLWERRLRVTPSTILLYNKHMGSYRCANHRCSCLACTCRPCGRGRSPDVPAPDNPREPQVDLRVGTDVARARDNFNRIDRYQQWHVALSTTAGYNLWKRRYALLKLPGAAPTLDEYARSVRTELKALADRVDREVLLRDGACIFDDEFFAACVNPPPVVAPAAQPAQPRAGPVLVGGAQPAPAGAAAPAPSPAAVAAPPGVRGAALTAWIKKQARTAAVAANVDETPKKRRRLSGGRRTAERASSLVRDERMWGSFQKRATKDKSPVRRSAIHHYPCRSSEDIRIFTANHIAGKETKWPKHRCQVSDVCVITSPSHHACSYATDARSTS